MKGFVKNEGDKGSFVLQRSLHSGATLSFDEAYLTVGAKSGKKKGVEFVRWLRDNCLSGEKWVFYKEEGVPYFTEAESEKAEGPSAKLDIPAKGAGRVMRRHVEPTKGSEITAKTIIEAPHEQARSLIDKCKDKVVLKKALALSRHFSRKEEHMRYLMKRLEQVY